MSESVNSNATFKLTGDNWPVWKFQISIILKGRGFFEVVDGTKIKPTSEGEALTKWLRDDAKAQEVLVTRIDQGPLTHLLSCETSKEMWDKLKSVFDKESVVSVHLLQQRFFMLEFDSSVSTFISKIEEIKNSLKTAGETLSDKMIITKILMALPEQYKHFRSAWESVPLESQTLSELTSRLLLEEERNKSTESTTALAAKTVFQKSQTRLRCNICSKVGHLARNCYFRHKNNKNDKSEQPENKETARTGSKFCTYCKKAGHTINFCWLKNRNKNGQSSGRSSDKPEENETNAFLVCSESLKSNDWCLDSGASEHMCWNKNMFDEIYKIETNKMVQFGNGQKIQAKGYGNINLLAFNGTKLINTTLSNVLYVPDLKFNLFSAGCALDKGYYMTSDNLKCQFYDKHGCLRAQAIRKNKLYTMLFTEEKNTAEDCAKVCFQEKDKNTYLENDLDLVCSSECMRVKSIKSLKEWHCTLGHQNIQYVKEFLKNKNIEYLNTEEELVCEECLAGKQHKITFSKSESRATQLLELVHADVCGPMETTSLGGARYFLLFKDDYSAYRQIYFLKQKSEVPNYIKIFISMAERQTGCKIKVLRTDNGLEFVNKNVTEFLEERGILHQRSVVYTPQQNGRAERENRTLVEAARTMMSGKLEKIFWAEVVSTASYILNRTGPSPQKSKTPYELWHKREYYIENFKIVGNKVSVHIPKENRLKWDAKNKEGIFLGYGEDIKGFRIYFPDKNKVETLRDVIFLPEKNQEIKNTQREILNIEENDDIKNDLETDDGQVEGNSGQNNVINENVSESEDSSIHDDAEVDSDVNDEIVNSRYDLRRNRPRNTRYDDYEMDLDRILLAASDENDEPMCYDDAMASSEAKMWKKAMEAEMSALEENETWFLVSESDVKSAVIECKWVYKKKRDEVGNITKYKARLVARGFQQFNAYNNGDIYSPVAKLPSIRIFLALCNNFNYKVHQLDVCSAFLNGDIDDEVYILLPKGFKENEGKFAKLRKSLYGLKSSPKNWYKKFHELMISLNFERSPNEYCIYIKICKLCKIYILIYVDDLLIGGSDENEICKIKNILNQNFKMKDLGGIKNFLGMLITQNLSENKITINQTLFVKNILKNFNMENSKPCNTPMEVNFKHDTLKREKSENQEIENKCRRAIGVLMYAMLCSRPDLCIAISILSRYQSASSLQLWQAIKRVFRYLQKTQHVSLVFRKTDFKNVIKGYADADWAGDKVDRKSTSGYIFKIFGCTVSWCSKKQSSVALSSTEAEYIALSLAVSEACWLRNLIFDFKILQCNSLSVVIFEDNQSAIKVCRNPEFHKRLKHIDIRFHFIRDKVNDKVIILKYISTKMQLADFFTKPLSLTSFNEFFVQCNLA